MFFFTRMDIDYIIKTVGNPLALLHLRSINDLHKISITEESNIGRTKFLLEPNIDKKT